MISRAARCVLCLFLSTIALSERCVPHESQAIAHLRSGTNGIHGGHCIKVCLRAIRDLAVRYCCVPLPPVLMTCLPLFLVEQESMQHLHGWNVFHLSHAPETICIDRDEHGVCMGAPVPNPRNHYGCKTFEPILGAGHCGNPYLHGHPTRDLDGEASCDCPTP